MDLRHGVDSPPRCNRQIDTVVQQYLYPSCQCHFRVCFRCILLKTLSGANHKQRGPKAAGLGKSKSVADQAKTYLCTSRTCLLHIPSYSRVPIRFVSLFSRPTGTQTDTSEYYLSCSGGCAPGGQTLPADRGRHTTNSVLGILTSVALADSRCL